jgi:hypothetical protein
MHLFAGAVIFGAYAFFSLAMVGYARFTARKRIAKRLRAVELLIQRDRAKDTRIERKRGCGQAGRRRAASK